MRVLQNHWIFFKHTNGRVTSPAQEPTNTTSGMTMINLRHKRICKQTITNCTNVVLLRKHVGILIRGKIVFFL